jgi:hypothetical protein
MLRAGSPSQESKQYDQNVKYGIFPSHPGDGLGRSFIFRGEH